MSGEAGSEVVLVRVCSYVDITNKNRPQLETVHQQMKQLIDSKVFAFSSQKIQNEIVLFSKSNAGLVLGNPPAVKGNATEVCPSCLTCML